MKFSSAAILASTTLASATTVSQINPFNNGTNATTSSSAVCARQCTPFVLDLTDGTSDASKVISRSAILTNGTFPGPPLKLNLGECVDFTIINNMQRDTGIHFHGIRQLATPWSDGVPGLSQDAVLPGQTYTYRWIAEEVGIYFYHSHYKAQMMDGLYGAIIIAPGKDTQRPFGLVSGGGDVAAMEAAELKVQTMLVTGWSQFTAPEILDIEDKANIDFACTDSIILNGQGGSYCLSAAALASYERPQVPQILGAQNQTLTPKGCIPASNIPIQGAQFNRTLSAIPPGAYDVCTEHSVSNYTVSVDAADKYAALSFISPAGIELFSITIDGHDLIVYQLNGNYITPQTVQQIPVGPGDRVSFLVKLDQPPADYTIRVANDGINQIISGFGTLSYKGATGPGTAPAIMTYGGLSPNNSTITGLNAYGSVPLNAPAVGQTADRTFNLQIEKNPTAQEGWAWVLNGVSSYSQSRDNQQALLFSQPSEIPESNLILRTNYNEWVDLIIIVDGPLAQPHPIHKHANKYHVIGAGTGAFNYSTVAQAQAAGVQFNLVNPPYLDGFTSTPSEGAPAWMVFRYQANTPGAWLLHCHIQTHLSGGMAVAILDAVNKWPQTPADVIAGKPCTGDGYSGNGTSDHDHNGGGSNWGAWTSSAAAPTNTPAAQSTNGAAWSVWESIKTAASSYSEAVGATTVVAGPTPSSIGGGSPGAKSSPTASSKRVDATKTDSATWASWTGSSKPVDATMIGSSTGAPWNGASTPVAATSASTWATWQASITPVAAMASASGIASYNGTSPMAISTYTGAAMPVRAGGAVMGGFAAGMIALLL